RKDCDIRQPMRDALIRFEAERAPAVWSAERRRQLRQQFRERRHWLARDAYGKGVKGGAAEAKVASVCGQIGRDGAVFDRLVERGSVDAEKSRGFVCADQLLLLHVRRSLPCWIMSGVNDTLREVMRHVGTSFQDRIRGQIPPEARPSCQLLLQAIFGI